MSGPAPPAGAFDRPLREIADYLLDDDVGTRPLALETARYAFLDSIGCALAALDEPACRRLLGPQVAGAQMSRGARVPGTAYRLEPVRAAWNIGLMLRWLDFNDTWLAAEWGHPSDNLGALLALADFLCRRPEGRPVRMRELLEALVKAYEIQGVIALENAFNRQGLDHVLLVRLASAGASARLLGLERGQILSALSNAWLDGAPLRAYRQAPNTGPRKSWAAGDACARGLFLALLAERGEPGYASALSDPRWGFERVFMQGRPLRIGRPFGGYVMEHILFKVRYPAEFHAQTAVEAAVRLHPEVVERLGAVERILIETQQAAQRIIDRSGPLTNPAARDHCLQYMVAVALLKGDLHAADYRDAAARDPRIDALRAKMRLVVNERFSDAYLDPERRAIGNALQLFFQDGSASRRIAIDYPLGHPRRRDEALPLLRDKFEAQLRRHLRAEQAGWLLAWWDQPEGFEQTRVDRVMDALVP